ncbi:NUDIX domain-containing protein [Mongoliibacter ruber]|uniref:8-oxo-dGTP pyrophosphatase MutT (NUDIX family) n=1 Tax=Mongoliibacter ruber TaxID=1750599 RepID=A0A2T0WEE7_9BACT|nr:NUDIX domain-containing protein [Mongoliibacter ruber]PRY85026.1 8-oxo-dGTP pyrophosphatase MutT (NUDIX family) [Mongoliibacter ruber]
MLEVIQAKLKEKPSRKDLEVVIVYPFNTETKEIFLIQEYIHSYARKFWKFVSGGVDKVDKDILTHAIEELAEEVAMESDVFLHLYSSERVFGNRPMHYFIAENPVIMENPPENPDEDYITDSKWVNEEEFQKMLDAKELQWDQGTMCALQAFRRYH